MTQRGSFDTDGISIWFREISIRVLSAKACSCFNFRGSESVTQETQRNVNYLLLHVDNEFINATRDFRTLLKIPKNLDFIWTNAQCQLKIYCGTAARVLQLCGPLNISIRGRWGKIISGKTG